MDNKEGAIAFIDHEVELLNKKSAKSGETKTQKENAEILAKIKAALVEVGKPVTITELQSASAEMAQYSNQKLSALLKKLVDNGEVVKTTEKKKSYFSAVEGE
jgi:6-pyruvoyl-tetrahydropterin synthase